ncbi:MAG: ribonuclease P protein component [Chloroflexi bacterium]|nr:MAG: ribonuclease P protein component [Chloroflexota bacterium]
MKRPYRLRRNQDFRRVRQEGRSWAHPLLILGAAPNDLSYTRIGVTASRRVGKAVRRNRAKRLLREAVRRRYDRIRPGWDLVLIARPAIVEATFHQVDQALEQLLQRAGLLRRQERPERS